MEPVTDPREATRATRVRALRREKIQRVADSAVQSWRERHALFVVPPLPPADGRPVIRPLPRPPRLGVSNDKDPALPPRRREQAFRAGFFRSLSRVFVWIYGALRFGVGVLWDKVCGRDSEKARAVRLRQTFEELGITFIKLGQQLSMRLDLLPYEYTRELENMLASVKPMPPRQAIAVIERTTEKKLDEIFSAFDTNHIGSASVACVYKAVLKTGEEVAVKVRRPKIGTLLAADMRALGWILWVLELFLFRPGFTANFLFELRMMLVEELDFVREARFNELFRRRTRKARQLRFATAPKIFFEYSNAEVLVAEFVEGIRLSEVLAATEHDDRDAICRLEALEIDPIILARRIQLIARFNNFENLFFHADLHPANMIVLPGNKIVLIDFGSCGSFSRRELNSWRRWFDAQSVNDVQGMVQAAMSIIEPLPPIDRDTFGHRLEKHFWDDLYAIKSKHSPWYDRISARLWYGFLSLSREFHVPMRLNTLRMIRASLLADTLAARLDHDQDPYEEYRHYEKGAGKRAKRRVVRRLRHLCGPGKFVRLENGIESGVKLFYRVQRAVDSLTSIGIVPLLGKAAEALAFVLKAFVEVSILAGAWTFVFLIYHIITGKPPSTPAEAIWKVVTSHWFQTIAFIPFAIYGRRMFFRMMHDRDYSAPQGDSGRLL